MSTFVKMSSPYRNFGEAIAVQDLREIHVWNSVWGPPEPKSWSRYWYSSVILLILIIILVFYAVNAYPNQKTQSAPMAGPNANRAGSGRTE